MAEKTTKMILAQALWKNEVKSCQKCSIAGLARNKVFGDGNLNAKIFLVGEAPGMEEDACGHPFIVTASAGKILDRTLKAAGLVRRSLFIANCLKCHPPKEVLPEAKGNRAPAPAELANCVGYLRAQIDIVSPRIIVAMGSVALNVLANPADKSKPQEKRQMADNVRRFWKSADVPDWGLPPGSLLVAAYHPQYLGYKHDEKTESDYIRLFRTVREIAEGKRAL